MMQGGFHEQMSAIKGLNRKAALKQFSPTPVINVVNQTLAMEIQVVYHPFTNTFEITNSRNLPSITVSHREFVNGCPNISDKKVGGSRPLFLEIISMATKAWKTMSSDETMSFCDSLPLHALTNC